MVVQIFVSDSSFLVSVLRGKISCVEPYNVIKIVRFVLIHAEGFRVQSVFLYIIFDFTMNLEIFEILKRFATATQLIIDFELSAKERQIVERLKMGKIFARILLIVRIYLGLALMALENLL